MNRQQQSAIRNQIIEYIKFYKNGGDGIAADKIINLFEGLTGGNCPVCKGTGKLENVQFKISKEELKNAAIELRKRGHSIRQIAFELGFLHPGSISHLLKAQ